jgi:hypothetical protein
MLFILKNKNQKFYVKCFPAPENNLTGNGGEFISAKCSFCVVKEKPEILRQTFSCPGK